MGLRQLEGRCRKAPDHIGSRKDVDSAGDGRDVLETLGGVIRRAAVGGRRRRTVGGRVRAHAPVKSALDQFTLSVERGPEGVPAWRRRG